MFAGVAGTAQAHSTRVGAVHIGHAWVLPSAAGATSTQGFVPLLAQGTDDRLLSVTSSRARRIEIRRSDERGNTTPLDTLRLQANAPIGMRPGRLHLAFLDIDAPFVTGERVVARFVFEKAGSVDFEFWVESAPYTTQPR
jgi:copper(I)-binding protein